MINNKDLLAKATMDTTDFGGATEAPLAIEQIDEFLRIAITPQDMLSDVRTIKNNAPKWQESKIEFGNRIMHAGSEATRLADGDREKGTTGLVEMNSVLIRGEVPISDEVFEDQVEQQGFGDTIMTMIAEAAGRDIEELMIAGDTNSGDDYLALADGWIKLAQGSGGNVFDAAAEGQDYQAIFKRLLVDIPDRFKRDMSNMRYYAPRRLVETYRDKLAARGTPLGDLSLVGVNELRYQGILIKGVANFPIAAGSPDTAQVLLTHRSNLYAGFQRMIKMETWRDPREGVTSFILNSRVAPQLAVAEATAIATSVNVEP